jgi:DNA-directed RNA polymerase subunit M/transcription elongation factor TFIIS
MKFCPECKSRLNPHAIGDKLIFKCTCGNEYDAEPEDTLRKAEVLNASESSQKYEVFIDNAVYDPGSNIVRKTCDKCGKDYMTRIYVGTHVSLLYICECGYKTEK